MAPKTSKRPESVVRKIGRKTRSKFKLALKVVEILFPESIFQPNKTDKKSAENNKHRV